MAGIWAAFSRLRESHELSKPGRIELALRAIDDGIWDWDVKKGEVWFSDRWKAMLGYGPGEMQDTFLNWQALIHPDDLIHLVKAWVLDCEPGHDNFSVEYRIRRKGGDYLWVNCHGVAVFDAQCYPVRMVGCHTDISAKKLYEESLLAYQQRLEEALAVRTRELEHLASHDVLTGLKNRAALRQIFGQQWLRAQSGQFSLAVIMIDIDYFKQYNDRFGHLQGDACLRRVAEAIMRATQRAGDVAVRYGGEEFLVLLPDTGSDSAAGIAESIRSSVEDLGIVAPNERHVTVSAGVAACVPSQAKNPLSLIQAADACLSQAKHRGRNKVVVDEGCAGRDAAVERD